MRVYCVLLVSLGVTDEITLGNDFNSVTGWIFRMIITAFGMIAVWQSQYLILDIFSPETSRLLRQSQFLAKYATDAAKTAANAATAYATGGASLAGKAAGGAISKSRGGHLESSKHIKY